MYVTGNIAMPMGSLITDGTYTSIDPYNRVLYASDGTTPSLNWSTGGRVLINGATDDTTSALQVAGQIYSDTGISVGGLPDYGQLLWLNGAGSGTEAVARINNIDGDAWFDATSGHYQGFRFGFNQSYWQWTVGIDHTDNDTLGFYQGAAQPYGSFALKLLQDGRVLINSAVDDTTSALQVAGDVTATGTGTFEKITITSNEMTDGYKFLEFTQNPQDLSVRYDEATGYAVFGGFRSRAESADSMFIQLDSDGLNIYKMGDGNSKLKLYPSYGGSNPMIDFDGVTGNVQVSGQLTMQTDNNINTLFDTDGSVTFNYGGTEDTAGLRVNGKSGGEQTNDLFIAAGNDYSVSIHADGQLDAGNLSASSINNGDVIWEGADFYNPSGVLYIQGNSNTTDNLKLGNSTGSIGFFDNSGTNYESGWSECGNYTPTTSIDATSYTMDELANFTCTVQKKLIDLGFVGS
jgi:hypothetical protein